MLRTWHLITCVLVAGLIAGGTAACADGPAAAPIGGSPPSTVTSAPAPASPLPAKPSASGSSSAGTRHAAAKAKPAGSRGPKAKPAGSRDPKAKPAGSRDPRFGTQYAILKSSKLSTRQITYDLIEWYDGKEAVKACAEDGVKPAENDYCLGYYGRNRNKKLRTLTVDPDAPIRIMDTGQWKSVDLGEFLEQVGNGNVICFDIDGGRIVKLDQIFLP